MSDVYSLIQTSLENGHFDSSFITEETDLGRQKNLARITQLRGESQDFNLAEFDSRASAAH